MDAISVNKKYVEGEPSPDVCHYYTHNISGQCWAHRSCALWSEGVCQGEGQSLLNVDRAIDSGSTKVSQRRKSVV